MRETFPRTLFSPPWLDGQIVYLQLLVVVVSCTVTKSEFTGLVQKLPDKGLGDADESIVPCGFELCELNSSAVSDCILLGSCTASAVPVPGGGDHARFYWRFVWQWQRQQMRQSPVKHAKCIIRLSFNAS